MMESNDIRVLHRLNKNMQTLISDLNVVVADISELTELLYNREIENMDDEHEIKLCSHMRV